MLRHLDFFPMAFAIRPSVDTVDAPSTPRCRWVVVRPPQAACPGAAPRRRARWPPPRPLSITNGCLGDQGTCWSSHSATVAAQSPVVCSTSSSDLLGTNHCRADDRAARRPREHSCTPGDHIARLDRARCDPASLCTWRSPLDRTLWAAAAPPTCC